MNLSLNFCQNSFSANALNKEVSHNSLKEDNIISVRGVWQMGYAESGEVNIYGKLLGRDKNMSLSEVEDLRRFVEDTYSICGLKGGVFLDSQSIALLSSTMSVDEFKQKWIEYKAQKEANLKSFSDENATTQALQENSQGFDEVSLSSKSSLSQSYKDLSSSKIQHLLKDDYDENLLELLFDKNSNETSLNTINLKALILAKNSFSTSLNITA